MLGIAAAGFFFIGWPEKSAPTPTQPEPVPEQAAPTLVETVPTDLVGAGRLLVDARPWGEVTLLIDSERRPLDLLPLDRKTPLVFELDPGRYTVFLTHPELAGKNVSCEVEVSDQHGALCRPDLLELTSKHYWEEIGWWR